MVPVCEVQSYVFSRAHQRITQSQLIVVSRTASDPLLASRLGQSERSLVWLHRPALVTSEVGTQVSEATHMTYTCHVTHMSPVHSPEH